MSVIPIRPISILKPTYDLNLSPLTQNSGESFEKLLGKALDQVNQLKIESENLDTKLASGQLEYVHQATVAAEKAALAMQLTIQIRNKVVEAYQEIMRIQV